ncbi:MAG: HU family DNA-binding protein [Muribaculaceae bacterium]|nr:HU family DNA-binding protein [Muribaculaceae bacterium]
MNKKITFPRLSAMLADKSGRSKRFSEDFLREFFSLISERLEAGESVKIKGLGTFRLSRVEPRKSVDVTTGEAMEISGHSKVVFVPAKELASAVNAPFEAFTAIEISDDADISQLFSEEVINNINLTDEPSEQDINESEELTEMLPDETKKEDADIQEKEEFVIVAPATDYNEAEEKDKNYNEPIETVNEVTEEFATDIRDSEELKEIEPPGNENVLENEDFNDSDQQDTTSINDDLEYLDETHEHKTKWKKGLVISLVAAVCALFATFALWYVFATNDFNGIFNRTTSVAKSDISEADHSAATSKSSRDQTENALIKIEDTISDSANNIEEESEVPTTPSDPIVYDTISTTRYLTTMAKAHYGNYNLWPFIYEENKAKLGHPDRIRPGTPVVIPKLSKYGIDASNPADIDKAKKMGVEIYARYGKSI